MLKRTKAAPKAPSGPDARVARRRPSPINRTFPTPKRLTWDEIKAIPGPVAVMVKASEPTGGRRSYSAGMTVLHRSRLRPLPKDHPARMQPRPDVLRRRFIRALRAQAAAAEDEQAVA